MKGMQDTIAWYNKNAEMYVQVTAGRASAWQIQEFTDLLPEGAKVLDAGCGGGRDTKLLSEKKNISAVGLDLSEGLLNECRKKFPELEFIHGNLLDLPFPDESFDGVWSSASLLHLDTVDDVKKALSEFYRVLKPKGAVFVLVKEQTGKEKTAVVEDTIPGQRRFFQYFTKEELNNLLTETGFTVLVQKNYNDGETFKDGNSDVVWITALGRKN